jgi:hypothetical protein
MKNLRTALEVVEALGIDLVCELTDANPKQAWHWYSRTGIFPAYTYRAIQKALKKRRLHAPDELWNWERARRTG